MKWSIRSVTGWALLSLGCCCPVVNALAATPLVVTLVCADYGSSQVVYYSGSAGAPTQTSGASCATQLATLQTAGFTNVYISVQTYVAASSAEVLGAPGGVNGTYTTYVLTNAALTSGNL